MQRFHIAFSNFSIISNMIHFSKPESWDLCLALVPAQRYACVSLFFHWYKIKLKIPHLLNAGLVFASQNILDIVWNGYIQPWHTVFKQRAVLINDVQFTLLLWMLTAFFQIFVCVCVCVCHGMCMEVRGQTCRLSEASQCCAHYARLWGFSDSNSL